MRGVGFTGTQDGMQPAQARAFARLLPIALDVAGWEFHHGDCVGSDAEAHAVARSLLRALIHLHPPSNPSKRAWCKPDREEAPLEYLARNREIVEATTTLIATPKAMVEELRSGTWSTIRYARKRQRIIFIVYPDGTVWIEPLGGKAYEVDLPEWQTRRAQRQARRSRQATKEQGYE